MMVYNDILELVISTDNETYHVTSKQLELSTPVLSSYLVILFYISEYLLIWELSFTTCILQINYGAYVLLLKYLT